MEKKKINRKEINKKTVHIQFVCMILVIFVHAYNVNVYGLAHLQGWSKGLIVFENLVSEILGNHVAVPLFMIISGFHFFKNVTCKGDILPKMKRRVRTLVIPYLFWNAVGCVYFLAVARIPIVSMLMNGNPDTINTANILYGLFLYKYYFPFWFLFRLICYIGLSFPIYAIIRKSRRAVLVVVGLFIVWISGIPIDEYTVSSAIFYLIGAAVALHCPNMINQSEDRKRALAYLCILGVLCSFLLIFNICWINKMVFIILPIVFWKAMDVFPVDARQIRYYEYLSFYLYCAHILILETVEKIVGKMFGMNLMGAWIDYLLAPFVTVLLLLLIYRIISRGMPRFTKVICGGRVV